MEKVLLLDNTISYKTSEGLLLHPYNGISELKHKYIRPISFEKLVKSGQVSILDAGFGVGYLSALILEEIWKVNPSCAVLIVGVEKDFEVVQKLQDVMLVLPSHNILREVVNGKWNEKLSVDLRIGDISNVKWDDEKFDLMLYDLYPPQFCKEVWEVLVLSSMYKALKTGGILITHTGDSTVRKTLFSAGFMWDETRADGKLGVGTIAWKV